VVRVENTNKQVLFVSAYLGGYPGTERRDEFTLFGKLYAEGYTNVLEGDEACLWVSKHPLPELPTYDQDKATSFLEEQGFTVLDLEEARKDLVPESSKVQQSYKDLA
jgi:hypothetical protein